MLNILKGVQCFKKVRNFALLYYNFYNHLQGNMIKVLHKRGSVINIGKGYEQFLNNL